MDEVKPDKEQKEHKKPKKKRNLEDPRAAYFKDWRTGFGQGRY